MIGQRGYGEKNKEKWCICVDLTNLHNLSKYSFSLPKLDWLIDFTTDFKYLSSLNANSGYH